MNKMNATHDTITIPLSLNSNYAERYFSKLERIDKSKPFCVAYEKAYQIDDEINTTCRFMTYNSFEEFNELTKDEKKPNKRWRELILENNPVVECYDLDAKAGSKMFDLYKNNTEDYVIDEFKNYRQRFMEMCYPAFEAKETFAISTACTKDKFSVHIAVRNGYYFENMSKLKIFMKQFELFLENTPFEFDMSIYKKNQQIRMLNNLKFGKNNTLVKHRLSRDMNDKDFLFGYVKEGDKLFNVKEPEKVSVENYEKPNLIFLENNDVTDYKEMTNSDCAETTFTDDEIEENIRKIRILLPMINCDTGGKENSFYKWSSVVKNCSYFSGMDDEIFDEVDDWAQGYDCYGKDSKKENKKKFYEEGNNSFCNFGTLVNFAKTDNPAEFEKRKYSIWGKKKDSSPKDDVRREIFEKLLKSSTHHSVANIYAKYCDNELFFSETCQFVMFEEKTKLWSTNNKKDFLIHKISKFFVDLVDEYFSEFMRDIIDEINQNEKLTAKQKDRKILLRKKSIEKLKYDVGSSVFISQVIKQLQCVIRKDESFLKVLESHPNLFAFSDGKVLDLFKNGEIRNIEKDDFIIKTCGYPYPERNQEDIDELMVKIKTLSDNPEQIKSLLSAMSLSLYGENKNQILIELTGSGGNGKGSIVGLKNVTIGNYAGSLDADIILNINGKFSIQQQSQIAQNQYCRSVDIVEPNDSFGDTVPKLSASTIKSFTGGDPVTGKFYNCDPYKFIARFTPCLQVNDELDTTSDDDGMRRRLKIIKLPLSFVENIGQELKSHERFKELNFSENLKVDKFRNAFLHILVDIWLETNGVFFESEFVKETTREYFESQTPAKDWFLNNYELCDENRINSTQLFNHFKSEIRGVSITAFGRQISKVCRKIKSHGTLMYFCKLKDTIQSSSSSEIIFDSYIVSNHI